MTVRSALGETFVMWRRSAPRMMAAALVLFIPLELAAAVFDPANDVWPNRGLYVAFLFATSVVATPWAAAAMVLHLDQGGSALGAYGNLDGRIRALVLGSWLAGIGVLIGVVLLVIPGLVLAARWSLLVPATVLERRKATEGLRRSNEIVKGATGRVLAIYAAVLVIGLLIVIVANVVVEVAAPGFTSSFFYGLSVDVLILPLITTASYVVYRRLIHDPQAGGAQVTPALTPTAD